MARGPGFVPKICINFIARTAKLSGSLPQWARLPDALPLISTGFFSAASAMAIKPPREEPKTGNRFSNLSSWVDEKSGQTVFALF